MNVKYFTRVLNETLGFNSPTCLYVPDHVLHKYTDWLKQNNLPVHPNSVRTFFSSMGFMNYRNQIFNVAEFFGWKNRIKNAFTVEDIKPLKRVFTILIAVFYQKNIIVPVPYFFMRIALYYLLKRWQKHIEQPKTLQNMCIDQLLTTDPSFCVQNNWYVMEAINRRKVFKNQQNKVRNEIEMIRIATDSTTAYLNNLELIESAISYLVSSIK